MGNDLAAWRARIGCFNQPKSRKGVGGNATTGKHTDRPVEFCYRLLFQVLLLEAVFWGKQGLELAADSYLQGMERIYGFDSDLNFELQNNTHGFGFKIEIPAIFNDDLENATMMNLSQSNMTRCITYEPFVYLADADTTLNMSFTTYVLENLDMRLLDITSGIITPYPYKCCFTEGYCYEVNGSL